MKFKIGQEVILGATTKRCIVIATKEEPAKEFADPHGGENVIPREKFDYIIRIIDDNIIMHVYEHQLIAID